jgi:hypothetical protein
MALTSRAGRALVIFVVLMFIMPFILVIFLERESPYEAVKGEPVTEAATATGISVSSIKDTFWNVSGATGGKTYVLTDTAGNTVTIATQSFDSAESRDAAVLQYNAQPVGRGRPVGDLIVIHNQLIYITPANSPILTELGPVLREKANP